MRLSCGECALCMFGGDRYLFYLLYSVRCENNHMLSMSTRTIANECYSNTHTHTHTRSQNELIYKFLHIIQIWLIRNAHKQTHEIISFSNINWCGEQLTSVSEWRVESSLRKNNQIRYTYIKCDWIWSDSRAKYNPLLSVCICLYMRNYVDQSLSFVVFVKCSIKCV